MLRVVLDAFASFAEAGGSSATTASVRDYVMQLEKARLGAAFVRFVRERALQALPVPRLTSN